MDDKNKQIDELKQRIQTAERDLDAAKRALFELNGDTSTGNRVSEISMKDVSGGEIIEGDFNGENMISSTGKIFPVPANYASKSKLVEGDRLKLTIAEDGTFLFKQIQPVERERAIGELKFEDNAYHAYSNGRNYNILYASITYHKAKPGDKVAIIIPKGGNGKWAVLENIVHTIEEERAFMNEEDKAPTIDNKVVDTQNVAPEEAINPNPLDDVSIPVVNPTTTSEKVIEPLPVQETVLTEPQSKPQKVDILGVSDIEIEPPKQAAPEAVQPEPTQSVTPQQPQVHPLEAADNTVQQEDKPVQEMEI